MSCEADVLRVFQQVLDKMGGVDHVVNNAGMTGRSSRLVDATTETITQTINLNVTGAILVAREAAKLLAKASKVRGRSIVNISSAAAQLGSAGEYVWYAASKGAIDSFTVGLARELGPDGVRVNAVSPGLTDTEIHERSTGDAARVTRMSPEIPMLRAGQPDEIAAAVVFLISDEASYISGANLKVSGAR
jgi:NAD(P)-dependent dehydrogenase (short-subunit alcohol dehydrogenase family)